MPSRLDSATPKTMYPMWLTNVKDSSRLMSFWCDGAQNADEHRQERRHQQHRVQAAAGNNSEWARMMAWPPTFVSNPANTAVTGAGAVG